ncbi:MAG: trehalose-phosphatase [Candidatus Rokubacteria bacterium]|nr:trehalose-phosphatase [Candidatus Rokubacteria bacterium]
MRHELTRSTGVVVILDYDGTLTPIVASQGDATLAPSVRNTLTRLLRGGRARLAVVSGRAVADIRGRVALPEAVYAGCHGLEIEGGGLRFRHPHVNAGALVKVRRRLATEVASIPGAALEWKGLALSLHYRRVTASRRADVLKLATRVLRVAPGLRIIPGHMVLDIVPNVRWDKGRAVQWIAHRLARTLPDGRALVFCAGDDVTDEAAFAALRDRGVTVRVRGGPTAAEYAVRGVRDVHALLRWLARAFA